MTEIIIRPAQLSDADAIRHLLERSWRAHWAPHVDDGARASFEAEKPVLGYVSVFLRALMVAERGGVVVGMYHLEAGWLHAIHVDTWAIGSGVGRALMDAAEAAGARHLEVRAFNVRARDFYTRRGWVAVSEHDDSEMGMMVRTIVMERD